MPAPIPSLPEGAETESGSVALQRLAEKWSTAKPGERANCQMYLGELCVALRLDPPRPRGSGYEYELPVKVVGRDGTETTNFVDLFKQDTFLLEAKDSEPGRPDDVLLRKAYGQARSYIGHLPGKTPPYVLVLDVAKTMIAWDRWEGGFGGFGAGRRIDLRSLHANPADVAFLRDIWTRPEVRDPRLQSRVVTESIAAKLASLATSLEGRGHSQEAASRFLIRCVFTMFAEDVRLLQDEPFRRLVDEVAMQNPDEFVPAVQDLWRAMDHGQRFGFRKLLRFNGHFFKDAEGLPLTREELAILLEAAEADWSDVQPAIFGTLLTRALDPAERHRLGAEYTPPDFIERVVRPAVEEPIRERWTAVQADVLQLREKADAKSRKLAEDRLRDFHEWLCGLQFLDPACGSGNFLYVTMQIVKRIEVEVLNDLADVTGTRALRFQQIDPSQFHGIETKPWAREIAELTLWIGFHQIWRKRHGDVKPEEPILRETGTLQRRDAILASDGSKVDPKRARQDPTPRVRHPVTGERVPDPLAKIQYRALTNPREAAWPRADFIIGNPPFMGQVRQREAFGDGYVDALRAAYPNVPDAADLVLYWWYKAAREVASGRTIRAGLITTQSITQQQNRQVVVDAEAAGARVVWAIPDHYWNDGSDDARVRVAVTVIAKSTGVATLVTVDGDANVVATVRVPRLNADLSAHANVPAAAALPLRANEGLSSPGFKLEGAGFVVGKHEAELLLLAEPSLGVILKPFRNGKDFTTRPREAFLIDFGMMDEVQAREHAILFDIVRDRVKPGRDGKADGTREAWWRLGRPREQLREALTGLRRFIVTPETSKHRLFEFLDEGTAADNSLIVIPTKDPFILGVLSSAVHSTWALAAGSRLGIDGTPRYNKGACFEAFPFPDAGTEAREAIGALAELIDRHRKAALARSRKVGMTTMYNVVEKLRARAALSPSERVVHELAACGTLRDLHDRLDGLVADAYGWPRREAAATTLDRLVDLHASRRAEEENGTVRWLRPKYQQARFGKQGSLAIAAPVVRPSSIPPAPTQLPWPSDAVGQITAVRALAMSAPITVEEATRRFDGGRRDIVARHLGTLALLGELHALGADRYAAPPAATDS